MKTGDSIAKADVFVLADGKPQQVNSIDLLAQQTVLLIAVPGAFTPTCDDQMPGYVTQAEAFRQKGIDALYCLSINDPFVMGAWEEKLASQGKVSMIADSNGTFTQAMDMMCDLSAAGLGARSKRYVALIENGVVTRLYDDGGPAFDKTKAEKVLNDL
ncbi:MAG: peroxiredoxin [Alphaproteobacteria bacterium GM202ARS2]|nr:peroxiredoxin [Alphaproteobacteria bacterium GM202ARS2]